MYMSQMTSSQCGSQPPSGGIHSLEYSPTSDQGQCVWLVNYTEVMLYHLQNQAIKDCVSWMLSFLISPLSPSLSDHVLWQKSVFMH